ncbi:DUF1361 domain-containing protein [Microbacterium sp. P03]|uniref:DUF1361 domain-containing protein n=1 Tax=Microbacterium sp. P03 TaxID=3366946 RepID=UPI003745B132
MILVAVSSVVVLNLYAAALILLRSWVYKVSLYRPMLLNIGLSFAPVLLALTAIGGLFLLGAALDRLAVIPGLIAATFVWGYIAVGTLLWLLFFPNSVYLITELNFSHRAEETPVPLWYDIVQTLALTLSGIGNAVLSLAVIQTGVILVVLDPDDAGAPAASWVFAGVVIVLGAVGVYMGRYLRVNSWDVRHPSSMIAKITGHLRQRGKALEAFGFVLTHAILIALIYVPLSLLGFGALRG